MPQAQLRSLFSAYYSKVFCHLEMRLKEKTIIKLFFRIQPNSTNRTTFWREKWINETQRQNAELHTLQRYVIQHPQHVQNVPTLLGAHDDQNSWGEKGEKEREMKDNFSGLKEPFLKSRMLLRACSQPPNTTRRDGILEVISEFSPNLFSILS